MDENGSGSLDQSMSTLSKIPVGTTIAAGDIRKKYRLDPKSYPDLKFTKEGMVVDLGGGRHKPADMHLYQERDVEQKAWEKHGGRYGFEEYLNGLFEQWKETHPGKEQAFPWPTTYGPYGNLDAGVFRMSDLPLLSWSKNTGDLYTIMSPGLLRIKSRFPDWLWKVCNERLDLEEWSRMSKRRDAEMREYILNRFILKYPLRPIDSHPTSPSVDALRAVLRRAPRPRDGQPFYGDPNPPEGLDCEQDEEQLAVYSWNATYLDPLFQALIAVINNHGLGGAGWKKARWEVYDTICTHLCAM